MQIASIVSYVIDKKVLPNAPNSEIANRFALIDCRVLLKLAERTAAKHGHRDFQTASQILRATVDAMAMVQRASSPIEAVRLARIRRRQLSELFDRIGSTDEEQLLQTKYLYLMTLFVELTVAYRAEEKRIAIEAAITLTGEMSQSFPIVALTEERKKSTSQPHLKIGSIDLHRAKENSAVTRNIEAYAIIAKFCQQLISDYRPKDEVVRELTARLRTYTEVCRENEATVEAGTTLNVLGEQILNRSIFHSVWQAKRSSPYMLFLIEITEAYKSMRRVGGSLNAADEIDGQLYETMIATITKMATASVISFEIVEGCIQETMSLTSNSESSRDWKFRHAIILSELSLYCFNTCGIGRKRLVAERSADFALEALQSESGETVFQELKLTGYILSMAKYLANHAIYARLHDVYSRRKAALRPLVGDEWALRSALRSGDTLYEELAGEYFEANDYETAIEIVENQRTLFWNDQSRYQSQNDHKNYPIVSNPREKYFVFQRFMKIITNSNESICFIFVTLNRSGVNLHIFASGPSGFVTNVQVFDNEQYVGYSLGDIFEEIASDLRRAFDEYGKIDAVYGCTVEERINESLRQIHSGLFWRVSEVVPQDLLDQIETLYVVISGRTARLPLHLYPIVSDSSLSDKSVVFCPSLNTIDLVSDADDASQIRRTGVFLFESAYGSRLVNDRNWKTIKDRVPNFLFFSGPSATTSNFQEIAPSLDEIFIICHGRFDGKNYSNGGLMLSDGMLDIDSLGSIEFPKSPFIFLGACDSGAFSGHGVSGEYESIAGMMLRQGAGSCVAAHWLLSVEGMNHALSNLLPLIGTDKLRDPACVSKILMQSPAFDLSGHDNAALSPSTFLAGPKDEGSPLIGSGIGSSPIVAPILQHGALALHTRLIKIH
ncbi:CHAT domain-containing protein [Mesobacterium pallidum]|uniref:CHAT domain-containing protein n=1 Tax=Mesobacterium pallidum TaxID=2872037 RepID=UPI001EE28087|nr:CHAT domain-containing protein [Mesobacterium pallidum]